MVCANEVGLDIAPFWPLIRPRFVLVCPASPSPFNPHESVLCSGLGHCAPHHWLLQLLLTLLACCCGAATHVQVVQKRAKEFLEKMNSKVIAPQLRALELIPESVECRILQSESRRNANAHLLNYLKADADEETLREVFSVASEETGYGNMNAFAASMLRELQ